MPEGNFGGRFQFQNLKAFDTRSLTHGILKRTLMYDVVIKPPPGTVIEIGGVWWTTSASKRTARRIIPNMQDLQEKLKIG
ncbi:hypothetical protein AgCh_018177 [Apium graveolens]